MRRTQLQTTNHSRRQERQRLRQAETGSDSARLATDGTGRWWEKTLFGFVWLPSRRALSNHAGGRGCLGSSSKRYAAFTHTETHVVMQRLTLADVRNQPMNHRPAIGKNGIQASMTALAVVMFFCDVSSYAL